MNAFIIIAAIVCITVITVFAIVMCKKVDKIARVYTSFSVSLNFGRYVSHVSSVA